MGVYRWVDYSVGLAGRLAFVAVRWGLRHPFGTAAAAMVVVAVAR